MNAHTPTFTFPVSTLTDRLHVTRCHNLRPSPQGGLRAVGLPSQLFTLPGAVRVSGGLFLLADGTRCMLVYHQGQLKALVGDSVIPLSPLDAAPSCALPVTGGVIVMPDGAKPRRFLITPPADGSGSGWTASESPLFPSLPPLMIERRDMGTVTADIPSFTLRSAYAMSAQHLTASDGEIADKAMRKAYIELSDRALLSGRYIQPVVARYRLIGRDGQELYTSAPVIISPESGLQATAATVSFTGEGYRQSGRAQLSALSFVPSVTLTRDPDEIWRRLVRTVELLVSPQLHPYSDTLPGHSSRVSATTSQLTFSLTLPGLDPMRPCAAPGGRLAGYIASVLADPDRWISSSAPASGTLLELARIRLYSSRAVPAPTEADMLSFRLSPPHSFTARACARSGDLIAWGGLASIPFEGYSLPEMAVTGSEAASSVPTAVLVGMRDGSSAVRSAVMVGIAPSRLSPLIIYPSAEAVSVTLLAGSKGLTLPLTPSPCGRWACYLAPDLRPLSLTDDKGGFSLPIAFPSICDLPSALVVCGESSPLRPIAVSPGDGSSVISLLPAVRHSNSFAMPSARFFVLGPAGISSMALAAGRRGITLNLLDRRGVASSSAATPVPGGIAVIASGALLKVTGSGPVTLRDRVDGDMLGWCDRHGELWCLSSSGLHDPTVLSLDGSVEYTRTIPHPPDSVSSVSSSGFGLLLVTRAGRILDPAVEADGEVTVIHESVVRHNLPPGRAALLEARVSGRRLSGSVTLVASHGLPSGTSVPLLALTVSGGALCHPLRAPVLLPHSHALTLRVSLATPSPSTLSILEP